MTRGCHVAAEKIPKRIWLMKTEPDVFSFADLELRPGQKEKWDGVRNYQARNFMRDDMKLGDTVLFYHSNASPPAIVGLAEIVGSAEPDLSALDPKSEYYDPKATKQNPRWVAVTVGKPRAFARPLALGELRSEPALESLLLLRKGQRLSILPVSETEFSVICRMGRPK